MVRRIINRKALQVCHRGIVMTRSGGLQGLKKVEPIYKNVSGVEYPGTDSTLKPLKALIEPRYNLPDDLLVQVLTHKSFAHGQKPYNQQLATIGLPFLRMEVLIHIYETRSHGLPVDSSHIGQLDLMTCVATRFQFARETGVLKSIFWTPRASDLDPAISGERSVGAKTVDALLGALLLTKGYTQAREFVKDTLLQGDFALIKLSETI